MATINDVAEKAGVSTATVSHVINETRFVTKPTKDKVIEAMKELNYKPNKMAQSLRNKKSKIIGIIVPDLNMFFTGIANHIEKKLKKEGYSLIISNSDENIENEKQQVELLNSHSIDGLIIAPVSGKQTYLNEVQKNNDYPIIFFDRKPNGFKGISILVENYEGSYKAIEYLIKKGHEKIGIIAGIPGITTTTERLKGYKKALLNNNIKINDKYICIGDSKCKTGYELANKLYNETDITALYVANNLMCIGAMDYFIDENIKIPDEIALIGFDDYKWTSVTKPSLSAIKQPIEEIGNNIAEILLQNINGTYKGNENDDIKLETNFIVRDSC